VTYHLVVMWGDIHPEIVGKFDSYEEMKAAIPKLERDREEDGVHYIKQLKNGVLEIESFSGHEMDEIMGTTDKEDKDDGDD